MFCQHRSRRAVFVEVIAGSFFLKALADCVAEGALLLFQKVKLGSIPINDQPLYVLVIFDK